MVRMDGKLQEAMARFERARECGSDVSGLQKEWYYLPERRNNALDADFVTWKKNPGYHPPCLPREGSHDSGPFTGFFYGGFGTASFSRGATGFFDRWQLRQGAPVSCPLDNACFELRWQEGESAVCRRLRVASDGFAPEQMEHHALYPLAYEEYKADDMPFTVLLESYSPVIPHNMRDSVLPVTLFNLYFYPREGRSAEAAVCFTWPNLLGWLPQRQTTELQGEAVWPTHQNSGNFARLFQVGDEAVHILQDRTVCGPADDGCGQVMVSMACGGWEPSWDVMFKETRATTGYGDEGQDHTIGKVRWDFVREGRLSGSEESWEAHWHEPTASALCARRRIPAGGCVLTFAVTMALPITQFGMGRRWYKLYTENRALSGAWEIASHALRENDPWLHQIEAFHRRELSGETLEKRVRGARINELYFLTAGGSVLVSAPVEGWDGETGRLGRHPHYGILEGLDTGYYYYNTLDLWVYAFAALSRHWPQMAEWVFEDYLETAALTEPRMQMIYRDRVCRENLVYGKLPHDLGGCAEDLFVRLNGYHFRDTPNLWKDHNPSFILAFYLHRKLWGRRIEREEYEKLRIIMDFTVRQDPEGAGIPRHTAFGDSTWDNLQFRGLSAYCGALCIGAWAVMERLAEKFGDPQAQLYRQRLTVARASMETLWDGRCYRVSEEGKYRRATMSDALFGLLLAKRAGLGDLLDPERIRTHLHTVYENNVAAFCKGRFGSLLVAEPGVWQYERDGGDELQVNEVLVGSSWVLAACLEEWGLREEARALARAMCSTIRDYGLQFRTPAAWNGAAQYRAPMNLRPLAVWLLP